MISVRVWDYSKKCNGVPPNSFGGGAEGAPPYGYRFSLIDYSHPVAYATYLSYGVVI